MDFLSETNLCGQTVLRLVSRGSAIIAELLRLSDHIPEVFKVDYTQKDLKPEQRKYGELMFDMRDYMQNADSYDAKVEASSDLYELDQEFKETHIEILKRFYLLFESIYKYVKDFDQFLKDLDEGVFIQQTIENVLQNGDGKQLLAEALYLFGVMLTLMDSKIEGYVRERMLTAYLRCKGPTEVPLIYEVGKLCMATGYSPRNPARRPPNYPEAFFTRYSLPKTAVQMIIGRLRSDDIYNQIAAYPLPAHRSTALAIQACMLYIILYFAPEILHNEQAVMREIVDKHFPDNWVIAYYLGYTVDLSVAWEPYKAAKTALAYNLALPNVANIQQKNWGKVAQLLDDLQNYLTEGVLVEEFILDNVNKLISCLRECNVTLRWLILHTNASNTANKKMRDTLVQGVDQKRVLLLVLYIAQFEFVLKNMFEQLLNTKQARWEECKAQASDRMKELAEYFSGKQALTRQKKEEQLQNWFNDISTQIMSLDYTDSTLAGRKIQQLVQALQEVEQYHQIDNSIQVRQFLIDTRQLLATMIRYVNIKEEVQVTISIVSDISYAWEIINNYVGLMQQRIKDDPTSVILLRSTFLKMSSILDLPLVRINQAASPDLVSVSQYYSGELVAFVRKVLEIIPQSMFLVLRDIIDLQTTRFQEVPTRLDKEKVRDFAQFEDRYTLARATHTVSVFTEGILAMETTLVGVIQVDPKQLLEDGIRKQLVLQIAQAMDNLLVFKTAKPEDFEAKLKQLAARLDGLRRSFQYIQDYINIYGLKIWQEEFSRIVNYNVDQECIFVNKKGSRDIYNWASPYQSKAIPIPNFTPVDDISANFIGRLTKEILQQTDSRKTLYLDHCSAWYDYNGRELMGIKTFQLVTSAVGVFGVTGVDKLLCFMIVKELKDFVTKLRKQLLEPSTEKALEAFMKIATPTTTMVTNPQKLYSNSTASRPSRLWPLFTDVVIKLGQMQLIRRQIANQLNFTCKIDSNLLSCALEVMNKGLIADIQAHYLNPDTKPYPAEDSILLKELSKFLETAGINDPLTKIYFTTEPIKNFPALVFLFVLAQTNPQRFQNNTTLRTVMSKTPKSGFDWVAFVVGVITLLKQFHSSHTESFLALMGQYVRSMLFGTFQGEETKTTDYPAEVQLVLLFLEDYCKFSNISRKVLEEYLPSYVFDNFSH